MYVWKTQSCIPRRRKLCGKTHAPADTHLHPWTKVFKVSLLLQVKMLALQRMEGKTAATGTHLCIFALCAYIYIYIYTHTCMHAGKHMLVWACIHAPNAQWGSRGFAFTKGIYSRMHVFSRLLVRNSGTGVCCVCMCVSSCNMGNFHVDYQVLFWCVSCAISNMHVFASVYIHRRTSTCIHIGANRFVRHTSSCMHTCIFILMYTHTHPESLLLRAHRRRRQWHWWIRWSNSSRYAPMQRTLVFLQLHACTYACLHLFTTCIFICLRQT